MMIIDLRLVASTEAALRAAIAELERSHGDLVSFRTPRRGRTGDWLVYGQLVVSVPAPPAPPA